MKLSLSAFRFRTLRGRLVFIFLSLLTVLQAVTFLLVLQANRQHALRQIDAGLATGERVFSTLKNRRLEELNEHARLLAFDYGFKQAFGASANDPRTMRLAMQNWRDRVRASFFVLVSLDRKVLYDSQDIKRDGTVFDLPALITAAEGSEEGETRGLTLRDGKLFAVVVVPLLAPDPAAWICLGFRIDDAFARELGAVTKQEVSFLTRNGGWRVLATTLDPAGESALTQAMRRALLPPGRTSVVDLGGARFVSVLTPVDVVNGQAAVLLQRNLDTELAPFKSLEIVLLGVGLAGLTVSAVAAFAFARSVAKPVLRLAQGARRVERGDYSVQHDREAERADEIGQLAQSFQRMTVGLAERDRVRDLLGKVASPAIAAELLRRESALGGEERCVTVLFSDLRDFSAISERLLASEVVAMLNAVLHAHERDRGRSWRRSG